MNNEPEAAMIFAAGFGTRMGALTHNVPKPMIPLAGRPMIDHTVELIRSAGIQHIFANTHYLADRIEPHLATLEVVPLREEPVILETGGGLKAALPHLGEQPVITMNPDTAWAGPNPVEMLLSAWRPEMHALLLLVPLTAAVTSRRDGDFSLEKGQISRKGGYIYTGAQIIRTNELTCIQDSAFSLNRYWDHLLENRAIHGVAYPGGWCDVGHPDGLVAAERMLAGV